MSVECGECEQDLRVEHLETCSRARKCAKCGTVVTWKNCTLDERRGGVGRKCKCGATQIEEEW